jgi:hypothetical protein
MKGDSLPPGPNSAGLSGILRLTAGLAVLALAVLAGMVVLDLVPQDQLAPVGRRIILLTVIVALASAAIAGLASSRKK